MIQKLNTWIFKEKGLRHFIGFFSIGYFILFTCGLKLFEGTMLSSFIEVNFIVRYVVFLIIGLFAALEIEYRQKNIHKKDISKSDIILSVLGILSSIPIFKVFENTYLGIFCIVISIGMIAKLKKQLNP